MKDECMRHILYYSAMSEFGGPESFAPGEGSAGAPEQLSEEAKQRFAAAAAAMQAIRREEKKSKKRDDRVARTIILFLGDDRYTHLFVLISRLVARDCPSIFILSILSLIDDGCLAVTKEYLEERAPEVPPSPDTEGVSLMKTGSLDADTNRLLMEWIARMQLVFALESELILTALMLDEKNMDGTVLQLATFVLSEFFQNRKRSEVPFEKLHPLTASILQTIFEPFLEHHSKKALPQETERLSDED